MHMASYSLSVLRARSRDPHQLVGFCRTPLHDVLEKHHSQRCDADLPSKNRQGRETGHSHLPSQW